MYIYIYIYIYIYTHTYTHTRTNTYIIYKHTYVRIRIPRWHVRVRVVAEGARDQGRVLESGDCVVDFCASFDQHVTQLRKA